MDYYVRRGGKITGPIDQESLHARAGRGEVVATDHLSHTRSGPWFMAGDVDWLSFQAAPARPWNLRKWLAISACANAILLAMTIYAFNRSPRVTISPPGREPFTVILTDELLHELSIEAGQAGAAAERAATRMMEELDRAAPDH